MTERGCVGNSNHHTVGEAKAREHDLARVVDDLRQAHAAMHPIWRDAFLAQVAPGVVVRVQATGSLGWRECERLIAILKVQRDVLAEDDTPA